MEMDSLTRSEIQHGINALVKAAHGASRAAGWYTNKDGTPKERNKGEMLMLIVSEVSEAMEGIRKNLMDDKLPDVEMCEAELTDVLIRVGDLAGFLGYNNLGGTALRKMDYNANRADHKIENRFKEGGKEF